MFAKKFFPIWKVCPSFLWAASSRGWPWSESTRASDLDPGILALVREHAGPPSSPGRATSTQASVCHSDQAEQGPSGPRIPGVSTALERQPPDFFFPRESEVTRDPTCTLALMCRDFCRSRESLQGNSQVPKNEMCNKA